MNTPPLMTQDFDPAYQTPIQSPEVWNPDSFREVSRRLDFEFNNYGDDYSIMSVMHTSELEDDQPPLDIVIVSHLLSKNEHGCFECPICYDTTNLDKRVTISCSHNFCLSCTVQLLESCNNERKNAKCPMCRHDCFLLETPDEPQYIEIGEILEKMRV